MQLGRKMTDFFCLYKLGPVRPKLSVFHVLFMLVCNLRKIILAAIIVTFIFNILIFLYLKLCILVYFKNLQ